MGKNAPKKKLIELDLKKEFALVAKALKEVPYLLFKGFASGNKGDDPSSKNKK